jgi:hypothetical protein
MLQLGLQTGRSAVWFTLKGLHVEVCGVRAAASDFLVSLNDTRDRGGRLVGNLSSSAQYGQGQGTAELLVSVRWRRERGSCHGGRRVGHRHRA